MTSELVTIAPDAPLKTAAQEMFRRRVSGLPVVEDGRLVGIITEGDFLKLEVERYLPDPSGVAQHTLSDAERVADVMTRSVMTVDLETDISEAARIMADQDIKRLPVVDGDGAVVGIISRMDIVAAFTRPDEVIEDEIREDLVRRVLFVDPESISVEVANGVVTFVGEIGTRNEAVLIAELAHRLDSVVRVDNKLTWRHDDTP